MDRESDNFTAELLLKQLGAAGQGTTAAGARRVRRLLAEPACRSTGVRIVDGSGLSRLDRLTARALVAMLRSAWADRDLATASLGASGRRPQRDARRPHAPHRRRRARAREDRHDDEASALSGYVRRRYVFSVLQNGSPVSTYWARRAQDRFAHRS